MMSFHKPLHDCNVDELKKLITVANVSPQKGIILAEPDMINPDCFKRLQAALILCLTGCGSAGEVD